MAAAGFVALWSTLGKTVQKSRTQVSCREVYRVEPECSVPSMFIYCFAGLWLGGRVLRRELASSKGDFSLEMSACAGEMWRRRSVAVQNFLLK